jgi:pimeloyl-ACP methyl ester carboxylesterase
MFQPRASKEFPVVLIISGSGPTDRDGNSILLPGKNNSLLQLADSLAQHGIGTLRYDKRGIGKSRPDTMMSEQNMTIDLIADDAKAMYDWLKSQGYKNIFIAGHSEGSLIGLMIASELKPKGFISIAGAGRKAGDLLKEQLAGQLSPQLSTELNNSIDSLERGESVSVVNAALMSLLRPSIQPYMKSWLKQDPQKLISKLSCPVLILQGTKDLQVKEIDAQKLLQAKQDAKLVMIKNMNHVLKQVDSDKPEDNVKAYSDPNLQVVKELISTITSFILSSQ